jgi:acyl carrier protein
MQIIGEKWGEVNRIVAAIEAYRLRKDASAKESLPLSVDSLESLLVGIWGRILGRRDIGVNDNFFEVGGTSLRAVQTVAAIKKELGCSISIVRLFESPTVKLLAANLRGPADESKSESVRARAAERGQQRRAKVVRRRSR